MLALLPFPTYDQLLFPTYVHVNRHLQRRLDEYAPKYPEKKTPVASVQQYS
jgi:hypothetical protein